MSWTSVLLASFFTAGFILLFITFMASYYVSAPLYIIGYFLVALAYAIICAGIFITIRNKFHSTDIPSMMVFVKLVPFFIILSVLIYSIYLFITYGDVIKLRHTSDQVYSFITYSIIITFFQTIIYYRGKDAVDYPRVANMDFTLLLLCSAINALFVINMSRLLTSATTDG
jgi:hypothetical protein